MKTAQNSLAARGFTPRPPVMAVLCQILGAPLSEDVKWRPFFCSSPILLALVLKNWKELDAWCGASKLRVQKYWRMESKGWLPLIYGDLFIRVSVMHIISGYVVQILKRSSRESNFFRKDLTFAWKRNMFMVNSWLYRDCLIKIETMSRLIQINQNLWWLMNFQLDGQLAPPLCNYCLS